MTVRQIIVLSMLALVSELGCVDPARAASIVTAKVGVLTEAEAETMGGIRQGNRLYSGDIIYEINKPISPFGALARLWPRGELVYSFDPALIDSERAAFVQACTDWASATGVIRCVERTDQRNYVRVVEHEGLGCGGTPTRRRDWVSCSQLGMAGGEQILHVYFQHWGSRSLLQHEIGHALGLIHEQQRRDRDDFVIVNWSNIDRGDHAQFDAPEGLGVENYSSYDFDSIMHYDNCTFSLHQGCRIGQTPDLYAMVARPCARDEVGGDQISPLDVDAIRAAYAPRLMALFPISRRAQCGEQEWSSPLVIKYCGTGCIASTVVWRKVVGEAKSWCGFATPQDGKAYCEARGQELKYEDWDKDDSHIRCWGGTLIEYTRECGCSVQRVTARCSDVAGTIDAKALQRMVMDGDARDRRLGKLLSQVLTWVQRGTAASDLVDVIGHFLLANYNQDRIEELSNDLLCDLQIYVAARRAADPAFVLSRGDFLRRALRVGLRT